MDQLASMTVAELAPLLRRGAVSPREVVEALLARIDDLDGRLHAYLTVSREGARATARAAERVAPEARGPLFGIPIAHKDVLWTHDLPTTAHSRVLADFIPPEDATVVARLRAAGTVLLGKLNTTEFACGGMEWRGAARNPWNTHCVPGTSSAGPGVALAAHLSIAATGSDTGGSIRMPAALCGVAGLKPTQGRLSRHGLIPVCPELDQPAPMGKCVRDLALLLEAMAGPDPRDPATLAAPPLDVATGLDAGVRGLRLGVPRDPFFQDVDPDTGTAFATAVALLEAEGASVDEVRLPGASLAGAASWVLNAVATYGYHLPWLRREPHAYGPSARRRITAGAFFTPAEIEKAGAVRRRLRAEFAAALAGVDAVVTPTTPYPAYALERHGALARDVSRFTRPVSLAGLPAASVPCGFSGLGLPIGLQVIGRAWAEATVLRVGAAYERATDWHRRRPDPGAAQPCPPAPDPPATPALPDPGWLRAFADAHAVPLLPEDVEPVARLVAPIRAALADPL